MGFRRKIIKGALALIVLISIVLVFNWGRISRLMRVNSLFDANKIVYNFSHMMEILPASELPKSGTQHQWPIAISPLPRTYQHGGREISIAQQLTDMQTTALLVVHNGTIVNEQYFKGTGAGDLRISWSMSKSFVSALTGLALANGDIQSLDDPVTKYVPQLATSAYNNVALRDVMHMASGVAFDEDYLDFHSDINKMGRVLALGGSLDDFAASITEQTRTPGTKRQYVSIDTHVLSMVLRAATKQSLQEYFVENLWSKIGASADAYYSTDSDGNAFALGGLNMRTRDYALFGELMRNQGRRGQQQIIPQNWVQVSTKQSAPGEISGDPFGYGYQWWVPPHSDGEFFAVGVYGQYIYVNPKAGIVIAKNAADRDFLEIDPYGEGSKIRNITLFRALAEHYSDWRLSEK